MEQLLAWYKDNGRHDLPWRKTREPYKVLVSELMLQQTQVSRVIVKYEAFIERFPTIQDLAKGERQEVLQLWQGLGYNSRAVRLHALAKLVVEQYEGVLPTEREELLKLPGIGPYTAGAIRIFSHEEADSSVDVNVARVIKRVCWKNGSPTPQQVEEKSLQLLERSGDPHAWHSAMMDFGSTICTARNPKCNSCPLHTVCKSKGPRKDEVQKKQKKFEGSNRWWRGKILRAVLNGTSSKKGLLKQLKPTDKRLFQTALSQLEKEQLIEINKDKVTISSAEQ